MTRDKMGTTNQNATGATVGSRMTHSLSTPSGVDGSSAPINRGGKKLAIRIQMLDDSVTLFQVQVSAPTRQAGRRGPGGPVALDFFFIFIPI